MIRYYIVSRSMSLRIDVKPDETAAIVDTRSSEA